ncbi:MAG TPA: hypothetical protein VJZ72_07905, partial [Candidatus Limnocylindrales bacterium]|nr:hypothetical protein [Candidatus Limnocylindrales bacterium]
EVMRSGRSATGIGDASATREGRFSADAVTAAPDALRVGDILRGVLPQEQELLRLMLLVPEVQVRITDAIGPDQLPNTVARELFRAVVLAREPDDQGIRPPFSLTALVQGLDPETASLAQALVARHNPDAHDLTSDELAYEVERLVIDLEERALDERHQFIQDALAEAEQAGDADAAGRRLLEIQAINDQRRSLHRRRDQTRLLVSPSRR